MALITLQEILQAKETIQNVAAQTPLAFAPYLSEITGASIYLKKENLQVTGAFKIRGAYNKIASLSDAQRACGVVAASAGNHAQGVALSASLFETKAFIVMPESTPLTKINGVKHYGAEVILAGGNYDEAYAYAKEFGEKNSLTFVHPFADPKVIAGQGTIGLEILESCEDLDAIIIPIGGGGLISGVATAIKESNPNIRVIGVSAAGAPAFKNSYDLQTPVDSLSVRTIADGIAVRDTSPITLEYALKYVDEVIGVDDEEIASAILYLLEKQKIVVEGAGVVGVAALLHQKVSDIAGKRIAVVLSGGNMDVTLLSVIIEKGLLKSGRKMKMTVTLIDKPGSLMRFTKILEDLNANIVHISYDRTSVSLDYGDADVTVHMETKGHEHQALIRQKLQEAGYLRSH